MPEQVGDAGVLIDPNSPQSIASGIEKVWTDIDFAQKLVAKGKEKIASYSLDEFCRKFRENAATVFPDLFLRQKSKVSNSAALVN